MCLSNGIAPILGGVRPGYHAVARRRCRRPGRGCRGVCIQMALELVGHRAQSPEVAWAVVEEIRPSVVAMSPTGRARAGEELGSMFSRTSRGRAPGTASSTRRATGRPLHAVEPLPRGTRRASVPGWRTNDARPSSRRFDPARSCSSSSAAPRTSRVSAVDVDPRRQRRVNDTIDLELRDAAWRLSQAARSLYRDGRAASRYRAGGTRPADRFDRVDHRRSRGHPVDRPIDQSATNRPTEPFTVSLQGPSRVGSRYRGPPRSWAVSRRRARLWPTAIPREQTREFRRQPPALKVELLQQRAATRTGANHRRYPPRFQPKGQDTRTTSWM